MAKQSEMKVMQFPSKYIQGPNASELLPEIMDGMGGRNLILVSKSQAERIRQLMGYSSRIEIFGGEASYDEIARVREIAQQMNATSMAAVGGGKVIDTAKIVCDQLNIPVIVAPTIAATDAPCSGCAVTYTPAGEYIRVEYQKTNPRVVLMDTSVIAKAPFRFLASGMGDAFATYLEALACEQTGSPNECKGGGIRSLSAMALCRLCTDTLFQYGAQAREDAAKGEPTEAIEKVIEANTLLSGLGFESGGLGMCHAISNTFTFFPECHCMYHGEKVAFGCLVELELYDPLGIREKTYDFFEKVGLPTTLADLRLPNATDEQILLMARDIVKDDPSQYSHHEPYAFDEKRIFDAIRAVDRHGRKGRI